MNRIIDEVVDSIVKSGLVEVEVSARHVHLTQEQIEILFEKVHSFTRSVCCPSRGSS